MTKFTIRYLSPEERQAYQLELLRILETHNASPRKRWGIGRADRCRALDSMLGDLRGPSLAQLCKAMEKEFYRASGEQRAAVLKEVAADA